MTETTSEPSEPSAAAPTGVRWWPPIAIVVVGALLLGITRIFADEGQERVVPVLVVGGVGAILLLVWLLFGSRLPRRTRVIAAAPVIVGLVVVGSGVKVVGVSGDIVPVIEWRWGARGGELTGPGEAATAAWTDVPTGEVAARPYPQFQGPARDAVVRDCVLDPDWSASPPLEVWRRPVGDGWSAFAVAGERAVTQEQHGDEERVVCYELRTGKQVWSHAEKARFDTTVGGVGPRATPTIDGGRVYAMGATGILVCLDMQSGALVWRADTWAPAGVESKEWGDACSPLVTSDGLVVVNPGGRNGWSVAAYRASDGEVVWHAGGKRADYSSPVLAKGLAGRDQVLMFNDDQLDAFDPATGEPLWSVKWHRSAQCVTTPLVVEGDRVLISTAYNGGAKLLKVVAGEGGALAATELWHTLRLKAKFTDLIERDGVIYGLSDGVLGAFAVEDGARLWRGARYGHGQVIAVGDLLIVQTEDGPVALVRVSPEGHEELGRIDALSSKTWNPPAFAAPFLLVRNDREAVCYRLALQER